MRALFVLLFAASWTHTVISFFLDLGLLGPLLLEALNSSFLYMPLANELLLLALITRDDSNWMWMVYALMTALGAVCGVLMVDTLMRRAGEKGLEKFVKPKRVKWLKSKLETQAFWVICAASAMPPPFPFRVVVLTASALQSPRKVLLGAVFAGRLLRFSVEAIIILYYGRRLLVYLDSEVFDYLMYALFAAAVVGSAITIYKWMRGPSEVE